jgi:hypothetical protein
VADFDSAAKRYSGIQLGEVPMTWLPIPDGTIGAGDRLHHLSLYSGIAAGAPAVIVIPSLTLVGAYMRSLSLNGASVRSLSLKGAIH